MVHGGGSHGGGGGGGGWGGGGHHGGGHHHHHFGGGSWFGGGNGWGGYGGRNNNTVIVVNNHDRGFGPGYRTYSSYQQGGPYRSGTYYSDQQQTDECEDCCKKLCECCFCCCVTTTAFRTGAAVFGRNMVKWFIFSVVILIILLVASSENDDWTFNGGESRRVPQPWLTNGLQFHSNILNGIDIYALRGSCPPLTGPKIELDDQFGVSLAKNDYQYDYFYLNFASTLEVTVSQSSGASSIMVIRGKNNFDCWKDDDCSFNSKKYVALKRFAGANQVAKFKYTVPETDFYVVIYDNASRSNSRCTVHYHANLTSYNLDGLTPISQSSCDASGTCLLQNENKDFQCILVQAKTDQDSVTVKVDGLRQWGVIWSITLVPILVGLFLKYRSTKKEKEQHSVEEERPTMNQRPSEADSTRNMFVDPSAPVDDIRTSLVHSNEPPPMAEATLEPSNQSSATIPIVNIAAENVIPVPPPTEVSKKDFS